MPLIELRKIDFSYFAQGRENPVLRDVDLTIRAGEMVAILGPSGSGKSTLLSILGHTLRPTSGSYKLGGRETVGAGDAQLAEYRNRSFGYVFQQFHLLPRADLVQNVLLGTRYNRGDSAADHQRLLVRARELLDDMGLSSHVRHFPNQLSGGQQQRAAIARALINDPPIVLADEPTGNLDSKSSARVLEILRGIHAQGRTVIIITHDRQVAAQCERIVEVLDGRVIDSPPAAGAAERPLPPLPGVPARSAVRWREDVVTAWRNVLRNKSRSLLTMMGVSIGVAAVLATITLGTYARTKILATYESLGVNKLVVRAYPRWNVNPKDIKGPKFDGIDPKRDIQTLRRLFPEIALVSPTLNDWVKSAEYGGKTQSEPRILGVGEEYFAITNRRFAQGRPFASFHVANQSRVCVLGSEVAEALFGRAPALRRFVQITGQQGRYSCQVVGVLAPQSSNNEWAKPNQQILMPYSFLKLMANRWNSGIYEMNVQMRAGTSIEELGEKIKQFFFLKYGRSARVNADSDEILVSQMRRFLDLFTMLLSGVALVSLAVGGIGITNMMLVSVSERLTEIGLRKALGARDDEIRAQFLIEAGILCALAGVLGLIAGAAAYHLMLYLASKLFKQVTFEWVFSLPAMGLSFACIVAVGLMSGFIPALRAQKLQVAEALRKD